jgi:dihydropteroate synthase
VPVFSIRLDSADDLSRMIRTIGADPRSAMFFLPKAGTLFFYVPGADFRAAAFIKQEILSRGGDAVVNRGVINATVERSDVLLFGSEGQIASLLEKLKHLQCWGLDEIRTSLSDAFAGRGKRGWTLRLPGNRRLELGQTPVLMGIVNVTPDSFHPESRVSEETAVERTRDMLARGAAIIDIGAESTRPGSDPADAGEELRRLLPPLRAIRAAFPDAVLSVDTYKGIVVREAIREGADIVNDISAYGLDPEMLGAVARSGVPYVLSHIRGTPATMQNAPYYDNLLDDMLLFFEQKLAELEHAGVPRDRIILDPGIGFGKRLEDNVGILRWIEAFTRFGLPLCVGHSRKGFIAKTLKSDAPEDRLSGTLAVTAYCAMRGVSILRVHDIRENAAILAMIGKIQEASL